MSDEITLRLDDLRAIAEVLADVLEARGVVAAPPEPPGRVLDAVQVARLLGRDRRWVYAHAEELGGFRYADGPRARLGFDLDVIERWNATGGSPRRLNGVRDAGVHRRRSPARA